MIGDRYDDPDAYPEGGYDELWAGRSAWSTPPEILAWLESEGVDPHRVEKHSFSIQQAPDGSIEIVFDELLPDDDGNFVLHRCPACDDQHMAKTRPQRKRMATPPPLHA